MSGFFSRMLTSGGGILSIGILFKINRLLFSVFFYGNFCGGDKLFIEGDKIVIGGAPTRENPVNLGCNILSFSSTNLSLTELPLRINQF